MTNKPNTCNDVCRKEYNEKQTCKFLDSYKRNIGTRNTQLSTANIITSISIIVTGFAKRGLIRAITNI